MFVTTLAVLLPGVVSVMPLGALTEAVLVTPATVVAALVPNIDNVGLNLFRGHTLGIELAAVILLLSMVGAIVIARQPVPGQVMTGYEMPPPTTSTEDLRHG